MAATFRLRIVTPERHLLDEDVEEVTAPGAAGEFGILPDHITFLTVLAPGRLVYKSGGRRHVLAVFGGCWYPSAFFPTALRSVKGLDPAGWAMDGFLAALSPAAGAGPAVQGAELLFGFALVVFLLAAVASRARRASVA